MARTLRNQNKCTECGYTWYPRGKDLSLSCPKCGSASVREVPQGAPALLGLILIGVVILVFRAGKDDSKTAEAAVQPTPTAETSVAPPEPTAKQEFIEPSRPELVRREVDEPPALPAAVTEPGAALPSPQAPAASALPVDADRLYSDEEIQRLEDEKRYHGDDPIVRSRLGLPSRETHRLVR